MMDNETLAGYLMEMERQSVTWRASDLADEQSAAMDFYEAKPFGDEVEGKSQVVVPVVQEVVDYMTVSTLRNFVSGDRVVEFEAKDEEGEEGASEATDSINQSFMHGQDGYGILLGWIQSGLIEKIGIVKTACVEETKVTRKSVTLDENQLAMALLEQAPLKDITDNEDGTFSAMLVEQKRQKRYVDMPVPCYEYLFSPRTRHEDEAIYQCHRTVKTVSDLVEMGFDRDMVEGLSSDSVYASNDERETALWEGESLYNDNDLIPGLRRVMLREEYARIDRNDDGIAELLKVFRVNEQILEVDECDEAPFVVFCPFPRAHRLVGNSLADKVMDIQRNKSVALRRTFDGHYLANEPRMWLPNDSTGPDTIGDMMTPGPGVIVRGKGSPPTDIGGTFDISKSLGLLEYMTGEQESRTGITRMNQGLDADAMNKTATGTALLQAQGQQIEEFVARNFGEAVARLFRKKLRLMREHGQKLKVRADGDYREVDPSNWHDDMDVLIKTGLGSGRKEARLAARLQVLELQREGLQLGLVDNRHLYNSGAGVVRDSGLGNPNDYFIDPDSQDGQPKEPKPDPEAMKAQAEAMQAQAKLQGEQQLAQQKMDMLREEGALKLQLAREQATGEATLAREKAEFEADQAERRMQQEFSLAQQRMAMERELATHKASLAEHNVLSKNRPGGSLSE